MRPAILNCLPCLGHKKWEALLWPGTLLCKKWGGIVLDAVPFLTWKSGVIKKPTSKGGLEVSGSSSRTRTYNSAVNSRVLYH